MTSEERIAKMAELKAKVISLISAYNEANQGDGKLDDIRRIDGEIEETVNEYTGLARDQCFAECIATGNPMLEAVKRLTFETIAVKDETVGEGTVKLPVRVLDDHREKAIDLYKLHNAAGGIGADKKWIDTVQKINFLLTAQKAVDLGLDPRAVNDSYAMSAIARDIDLGKTPTSKTNMLRTLQTAVSAMIGDEYKATSHDVNFLLSVFSRKNRRALTVSCATHKYMRGYMAEICHRIVTGGTYALDYKQVKSGVAPKANIVDPNAARDAAKAAEAPKAKKSAKKAAAQAA